MNYKRDESPLRIKSYAFAVRIVKMVKCLANDIKLQPIYTQILKSGTSIAANLRESEFAQSPSDFISKLSIALKEANETLFWLNLLKDTECITIPQFNSLSKDCDELVAMLIASIKTTKININLIK
jgi:four helix bundle protein